MIKEKLVCKAGLLEKKNCFAYSGWVDAVFSRSYEDLRGIFVHSLFVREAG